MTPWRGGPRPEAVGRHAAEDDPVHLGEIERHRGEAGAADGRDPVHGEQLPEHRGVGEGRGEQKGRNPFEIVKANGPFAGIGHNGAPTIAMDQAPGMSAWASGS